eukprot:Lithocolla_globosa_v1_NODE_2712_length_1896_cov_13.639326.p2 type:complete len:113 gc:universal NODE_2712_length_1896_cov_13.639326:1180-1518(+)
MFSLRNFGSSSSSPSNFKNVASSSTSCTFFLVCNNNVRNSSRKKSSFHFFNLTYSKTVKLSMDSSPQSQNPKLPVALISGSPPFCNIRRRSSIFSYPTARCIAVPPVPCLAV